MKRLAGGRVSCDFGPDSRPTSLGMLIVFEHKHPRPFRENEAIAVGRKRPRGTLGLVVPGLRQRAHERIALDDSRCDRSVYPSNKKHRLNARLDMLVGEPKRVARRRTARRDHVAVSTETKAHGDFAGDRPHGSARNAEQADLLDMTGVPEPILLLRKLLRSPSGAENHTDLPLLFERHLRGIEACI